MFSGIVTAVGEVVGKQDLQSGQSITVEVAEDWLAGVNPGASIAINGACMTVTTLSSAERADKSRFCFDISRASLDKTCGLNEVGSPVNLEHALRIGDPLDGHLVTGHVDGTATVISLTPVGESICLSLAVDEALKKYCALKGSLCIHGVSLTLNRVTDLDRGAEVSFNLIPHTMAHTNFGQLHAGDRVNVEIDVIARYLDRFASLSTATAPQN